MNEYLNPENTNYSIEELDVKKISPLALDNNCTGQDKAIDNLKSLSSIIF
jgi:hypothetical protein